MPLEGKVTFGAWNGSNPTSSVVLIGTDGQHYILGNTDVAQTGFPWRIGRVESENIIENITADEYRATLATRQPLSSPFFTASRAIIPVQGTPYFLLGGTKNSTRKQWGLVTYRIDDPSTVVDVGSILLDADLNTGPNEVGVCFGVGVLASDPGYVYVVLEGGYVSAGTAESWVARLPVSETNITDLSANSLSLYATRLSTHGSSHPLSWHSFYGFTGERTDSLGDKVAILPDPDHDVGLLRRVMLGATPAIHYAAIDIGQALGDHGQLTQPAFTGSYISDVSSHFGLPWADAGNHLDLTPSIDDHDDYTQASHLGDGELVFPRSDSAVTSDVFLRRFVMSGVSSVIPLGTLRFTHNSETISGFIQAVQAYRLNASTVLFGLRDGFSWIFGETALATPPDDVADCAGEDEADAIVACDVNWDPCILVPEHITVAISTETVSPGRSLGGRKQFVQRDAGFLRVTLHGVKVWSNTELFTWREYESKLNGRNGTCCVPLYEGKLSATPIVSTLGANASIGAVRLTINQSAGASIRVGMHFQAGERAYRLVSGSGTSWKVYPPLRAAISSGATLNFNAPKLRCRLARDNGMDIMLQHLRFGKQDVEFIEDV